MLPHEIPRTIKRTILELNDKLQEIGSDSEFLDSFFNRYQAEGQSNWLTGQLTGNFAKAGDKRKNVDNRDYVNVSFSMNAPINQDVAIATIRRIKQTNTSCDIYFI